MASIRGKITNPVSISTVLISETEAPINLDVDVNGRYQSASQQKFIETEKMVFFPIDLSNIDNILSVPKPTTYGNGIFRNRQTVQEIQFYLTGNSSENTLKEEILPSNSLKYIDGGKKYTLYGVRNESLNFGNINYSNEELYPFVERSDFDSFDFPEVTIRGTRKIPVDSGDTLCGPITYTGYTYDRLNYNWLFGKNAGITFNPIQSGSTPIAISGSVISNEGVSSISNRDGKLLFYTNGENIYTSGGTIMSNGSGLVSSGTSTQSTIIVPKPNSNKYYVFTTDYNGSTNGFNYSIVNMDLNNGEGQVEAKNINLFTTPTAEKVTACNHINGEDFWVITHTSGDTTFYSYLLSSSGLGDAITTNIGSTHNTVRGYMKTSLDSGKLISLLYDEDIIDIFDFDPSGGTISNWISLTGKTFDVGPYGLEFSSDSSKFYVSEGSGDKIYQYDLSYSGSSEILDNEIIIAELSGSSLGSLQMGPDERIYVAENNSSNLHIIHRPDGLGVLCNFEYNGFTLTSTTLTGSTSYWGLPNVVTSKSISPDRYVYIIPQTNSGFTFQLLVNNVNDVVVPKDLNYYGEIYKYDKSVSAFTNSVLTNFNISNSNLSGNSYNDIVIPSLVIGEGEFLIKSYWDYKINTLVAKQQNSRKNSVNTYRRGIQYGLYYPETDWYFINVFEAEKPLFNNSTSPEQGGINTLRVYSNFTVSGQTDYSFDGVADPIVSYNGSVLAKNIEYSAITTGVTSIIRLNFIPLDNQVLTYAYITDGSQDSLYADLYNVTSAIPSGTTGTQGVSDRVFYNTTHNKYEFYLLTQPASDVLLSINGSLLYKDVEYYNSLTDSRRIILEENISVSDVIEAFYQPANAINGGISTNKPTISWSINSAPLDVNGRFVIEVTDPSDTTFQNIIYSGVVDYVVSQKTYSDIITLTNAVAGDKFIYRVKNEKFYTPIMGEIIYTVNYSDINKIEILTNVGNSY
jgi:hypothetical protein